MKQFEKCGQAVRGSLVDSPLANTGSFSPSKRSGSRYVVTLSVAEE